MPTPDEEVERLGVATAWAGGFKGRRVIDRVLPQVRSNDSGTGDDFALVEYDKMLTEICMRKSPTRSSNLDVCLGC